MTEKTTKNLFIPRTKEDREKQLTELEFFILLELGLVKFATNKQLAAFLLNYVKPPLEHAHKGKQNTAPPKRTGRKITDLLSRLFYDGFYVDRRQLGKDTARHIWDQAMVYNITPQGKQKAAEYDEDMAERLRTLGRNAKPATTIPHNLEVTNFAYTLRRAVQQSTDIEKVQVVYEQPLLKTPIKGSTRKFLVADAVFQFTLAHGKKDVVYYEADMSNDKGSTFNDKFVMYDHFFSKNPTGGRVVISCLTQARIDYARNTRLNKLNIKNKSAFYFVQRDRYDLLNPSTILEPIFVTGKHSEPRTLF